MNDRQSKLVSQLTDLVIDHQAGAEVNVSATPIRFGLADLTFVAMLIAVHMMFIFNWVNIRAGQGDIVQRALSALLLSAAVVAGPAYLSFRLITEYRIQKPIRRMLMLLGAEALVLGMFFVVAVVFWALMASRDAFPLLLLGVVVVVAYAVLRKPLQEARERTERFNAFRRRR